MKYNKSKRTLSVLSAILGLLLSIIAVGAGALGVMGLINKENPEFAIGSSINEMGLKANFADNTIKWAILVIVILFSIANIVISIKLISRPLEINEKFVSKGGKKLLFCIFTLIAGAMIPLQILNKNIVAGDKTVTYVIFGITALVVLMQFFSMFLRSVKKEKVKKDKKSKKEIKAEKAEKEVVAEKEIKATELVPAPKNEASIFGTIANDPKLDSFEQRVREIKHLKEAGLINNEQAAAAVENIIDGFLS